MFIKLTFEWRWSLVTILEAEAKCVHQKEKKKGFLWTGNLTSLKKNKKLDCVFWSVSVLTSSQQPRIIMKTRCHVQRRWQLGGCYENIYFFVLKRICRGQKNRWQKISGMQWKAKSLVSLWSLNCFSVCPQLLPWERSHFCELNWNPTWLQSVK